MEAGEGDMEEGVDMATMTTIECNNLHGWRSRSRFG